jgi:hypothetical protein
MRRRKRQRRWMLLGGVLAVAVAVMATTMLMPGRGDISVQAGSVQPQALNRIAQKNNNAAVTAAAAMRERSARTARSADALQDQQDRNNAAAQ